MISVPVAIPRRSYAVAIGAGLLDQAGDLIRTAAHAAGFSPARPCAIITNPTVDTLYGARVADALSRAGFAPRRVHMPDGEEHKNLRTLETLFDGLVEAGIERRSILVSLGGGVVGDMAGLAAATFLRGVPFFQIPTTLLAQVDSSIGGKVGCNLPRGKNLVGSFYQPFGVLADVATLATLPDRQYRSGMAEMVKHGVIADAAFFAFLEGTLPALCAKEAGALEQAVAWSCRIKASVVVRDETEQGLRAILNYGHTVGHALESVTNYTRYLHGEAVAVGMAAASFLALRLGLMDADSARRQEALLRGLGLPVRAFEPLNPAALAEAIRHDKKIRDGRLTMALSEGLGRCRLEPVEFGGALDETVKRAATPEL